MVQEFVPHVLGERGSDTRNNGKEMSFERADGPFYCIVAIDIGKDELIFGVPGVFNDILLLSPGFVFEYLEIHLVASFFQPFLDGGVGFDTVFFAACLELCLKDGVGFTVVCDHDLLFAAV